MSARPRGAQERLARTISRRGLIALLVAVMALGITPIAPSHAAAPPDWDWATSAGRTDSERGNGIAVNGAGNSYM
jgi:hypothetical protein